METGESHFSGCKPMGCCGFQGNSTVPSVKFSGGRIMAWGLILRAPAWPLSFCERSYALAEDVLNNFVLLMLWVQFVSSPLTVQQYTRRGP